MGGDSINVENVGGFSSQSGPADCENDGSEYRGRRVGVTPSGLCDGISRDMADQGIHLEVAGHHSVASALPANV